MNPKIITTSGILAAALLAGVFLTLPQFRRMQSIRADVASRTAALEAARKKVDATSMAIANFQRLEKKQVALVENALPEDVDLPNLFVLLEFIVSSSGLTSENIAVQVLDAASPASNPAREALFAEAIENGFDPERIRPPAPHGSATVNISVRGNYESFKSFLGMMERSLRIFDVESISFSSPAQTKEKTDSFNFSLILKTYFAE